MLCVPLFHVTGLVPVMLGSFVSGAKLVMTHKWDPDRALELIEQERVTNFVGVPTMSWDLLEAPTFAAARHVEPPVGRRRRRADATRTGQAHRRQLLEGPARASATA